MDKSSRESREVGNLFQAYGAVDHHVEVDPDSDPAQIAPMLPIYQDRHVPDPHWFRKFAARKDRPLDDPEKQILKTLNEFAKTQPPGRLRARRTYAVAVVADAFPDISDEKLAAAVLGRAGLKKAGDAVAEKLVRRLRSKPEPSQTGRDSYWDSLREAMPDGDTLGPRPCSGGLSWVTRHGDRDLVPTLKTVSEASLEFDHAKQFCLDPETWQCFPSWCKMEKISSENGFDLYKEVVSFRCGDPEFPELTVHLNFAFDTQDENSPTRRVLTEYWLSDKYPSKDVLVNQGWLEIKELSADTVQVTTTKTVQFDPELGGPGLASVSCRVGYLGMVGDLVNCASKQKGSWKKGDQYPDVDSPEQEPSEPARRPDVKYGGIISLSLKEAAGALEDSIDECAKAARASYDKLDTGYDASDLIKDMATNWVSMFRGGARFANAGLRVARTTPRPRPGG